MRLYHGTSSYRWSQHPSSIQQRGLQWPYLTDSLEYAYFFAYTRAQSSNLLVPEPIGDPIVLEVEVDEAKLIADTRPYDVPWKPLLREWDKRLGLKRPMTKAAWDRSVANGTIPLPRNDRDWQTSLAAVHAVRYNGQVPPDRIRVIDVPSPNPSVLFIPPMPEFLRSIGDCVVVVGSVARTIRDANFTLPKDIDLLVDLDSDRCRKKIQKQIARLGLEFESPFLASWTFRNYGWMVEIIGVHHGPFYRTVRRRAERMDIDGVVLWVAQAKDAPKTAQSEEWEVWSSIISAAKAMGSSHTLVAGPMPESDARAMADRLRRERGGIYTAMKRPSKASELDAADGW